MAYRLDTRSSRTMRRRKARVLACLGDKLIHAIRTEQPPAIWVTPSPASRHNVDMGVWSPSPGETFLAHFHASDDYRLITVRLKQTTEQINDPPLEFRPLPTRSKKFVVLI